MTAMRKLARLWALAAGTVAIAMAQTSPPALHFDAFFTSATMRVDYYHTGGPGGEVLALDRIVADGAWPGSRTRLVDTANLGKYLVEVLDRDSNRVIYSRGFASVFGEWETTADVRSTARTFSESIRFPWPKAPVRLRLKKRDGQNAFREFWSVEVDPASRVVNRADRTPAGRVWTLLENGQPADKVDVLLISEGYTAAQLPKFHADAARLIDVLFSYEPFKGRRADFNVRGLDLPSEESGVTRPRAGVFRRTPLSVEYNIFDLERYLLTYDNRTFRDAASAAPYDVVEILVNDEQYGGGGIFNLLGTVAVGNARADYVFVHEFGHNLAGLGDEYTGNVTYETGVGEKLEPWEPNLTALLEPNALKWRDLVEPGTPVPTPASFAGRVGAFEGGGYETRGIYRPESECIMGSTGRATGPVGFCRVCQRAISRIIDSYSRP
jgi:IgA Peptidase M64/Peptidase M64 N-terminus